MASRYREKHQQRGQQVVREGDRQRDAGRQGTIVPFGKPVTSVETIDPAKAKEYLRTNTNQQRTLSTSRIAHFADEMKAGRWQLNGESLIFDSDGRLIDGQHRLVACIRADCSFTTVVVRNVAPESFQSIDTAGVRSRRDVLSISGEKYRTQLAAGLRLLWEWERGRPFPHGGAHGDALSNTQVLDYLEKHPRMRECAAFAASRKALNRLLPASRKALNRLLPASLTTVLAYVFSGKDATMCKVFFDAVESGANLHVHSPTRLLRERLVANRGNKAKLPSEHIAALTIKAWNAERANREMRVLKFMDGEEFPDVQ
jgi:DNA-binding transcriptional regulator YiaG